MLLRWVQLTNSGIKRRNKKMPNKRTPFRTNVDGFAFKNSWTMTDAEKNDIRNIIAGLTSPGSPLFPLVMAIAPEPLSFLTMVSTLADYFMDKGSQGYCGGMAYASLDYYRKDWIVPRGNKQSDQPGPNSPLRQFIWSRLLDSLSSGGAAEFICTCWLKSKLGQSIDDSRGAFDQLKKHIDAGQPWPIILFRDMTNPLKSHQVLAIGYDDPGDGTATITTYDNNSPDFDIPYAFNFAPGAPFCATDGSVRAFKCSTYAPKDPPVAVGQSSGMEVAFLHVPHPKGMLPPTKWGVSLAAKNVGYHQSLPFRIRLLAQDSNSIDAAPFIDAGGESVAAPLDEGQTREAILPPGLPQPLNLVAISSVCEVQASDGTFLRRTLPSLCHTVRTSIAFSQTSWPLRILVHLSSIGDWTFTDGVFAGATGQRLEGFQINVPIEWPAEIEYMAHVQGIGDTPWLPCGEFVGTRGQSLRLEGFAIRLKGTLAAGCDVHYSALMDGIGWSPEIKNGEFCGTRSQSRRVQGIIVSLGKKA
jgi:hypothetical protein